MRINIVTVIFTIFNVIIMFWFLKRKLFIPITTFMENRTNLIGNKLEDANQKQEEALKFKDEYKQKLILAENEGKKIVEEYKIKAMSVSEGLIDEAKKEANLIKERAKNDAEREKEKAKDEIRNQIVTLSLLAASKSIGEQLDENKHHVLIQEFINKVGV